MDDMHKEDEGAEERTAQDAQPTDQPEVEGHMHGGAERIAGREKERVAGSPTERIAGRFAAAPPERQL